MKYFCTENCNECEVIENRQLALLLNYLIEKYGEQIIQEVNKFCPNLTCCPDCRIDDFCHINGCEIYQEAKELTQTDEELAKKAEEYAKIQKVFNQLGVEE